MIDDSTQRSLMRLLHGELTEAQEAQLRQRLQSDSELRRAYQAMERFWGHLEAPTAASAPYGFATRVAARARELETARAAPTWWSRTPAGRAATAALLAGGIGLGALLAWPRDTSDLAGYLESEPTMAETYLQLVIDPDASGWEEQP